MKEVCFLTSQPLPRSFLAQKMTVIGHFGCTRPTFHGSKLKTTKNNNLKTRFQVFSPLATLSFATHLCNQLRV